MSEIMHNDSLQKNNNFSLQAIITSVSKRTLPVIMAGNNCNDQSGTVRMQRSN